MRIEIYTDNTPKSKPTDDKVCAGSIERRSYEVDYLDEEIVRTPLNKSIEHCVISGLQLNSKDSADKAIKLLKNIKDNFK
jgi:hypothetical protein